MVNQKHFNGHCNGCKEKEQCFLEQDCFLERLFGKYQDNTNNEISGLNTNFSQMNVHGSYHWERPPETDQL